MSIQEFIDRTGLHPTEEKFASIHEMYMHTNLDKDAFCKEYKKCGNSPLVEELVGRIESKTYAYDCLFESNEKSKVEQAKRDLEMAMFLLDKADIYSDPALEEEAIKLVSRKTVVLIKIKHGHHISSADYAYIAEHLQ